MFELHSRSREKICAIDVEGNSFSYGHLADFVEEVRDVIVPGSLVFMLCENSPGALFGYVGCLENGIVSLLLDRAMDALLLQNLMDIYRPSYLWVPEAMVEDLPGHGIWSRFGYMLLKMDSHHTFPLHPALSLLISTSGSTGSPKLVRQSAENILSNAQSIADYLELDDTERAITMLPMNYVYGLSVINSHLLVGATLLLTNYSIMQRQFWDFFRQMGATSVCGVPYTYEMLKKLRFLQMDLPSLRYMTQAGGKLLPTLHQEYAEHAQAHGQRFYVMYGAAEATARMGYLPAEKSLEKCGSMGVAIPGGSFSLVDTDGHTINEIGNVGELVYRGKNVTLGYAENGKDLSLGDERHGMLMTGDMAYRDADGYYFIVGRKKRFVKIFGNRVNLDETERLLKAEFEGQEFACVGVDDRMTVYVTDGQLTKLVSHFLSEKTKLHHSAFIIKIIDEIPKNESGKTQYTKLET